MNTTPPKNPVSKYLMGLTLAFLAYTGIVMAMGGTRSFHQVATLLSFLCTALFIVWTVLAIRIGRITIIGQRGQVSTFDRATQPGFFWGLALAYLVVGLTAGSYLGSVLLASLRVP